LTISSGTTQSIAAYSTCSVVSGRMDQSDICSCSKSAQQNALLALPVKKLLVGYCLVCWAALPFLPRSKLPWWTG
jgi:hypothetical protein